MNNLKTLVLGSVVALSGLAHAAGSFGPGSHGPQVAPSIKESTARADIKKAAGIPDGWTIRLQSEASPGVRNWEAWSRVAKGSQMMPLRRAGTIVMSTTAPAKGADRVTVTTPSIIIK
jgi:hypothetical protein